MRAVTPTTRHVLHLRHDKLVSSPGRAATAERPRFPPEGWARIVAIVAGQAREHAGDAEVTRHLGLRAHERDGGQHGQRRLDAGHRLGSDVGDAVGAGRPRAAKDRQAALVDAPSLTGQSVDIDQEARDLARDVVGVLAARAPR